MALNNFSAGNTVIEVNGRELTQWGKSTTPYSDKQIDALGELVRGMGGGAYRNDRTNPGREVVYALLPGSADSAFMQGLINQKADITSSKTVIGTLEVSVGTEGMFTDNGESGRAGMDITDDIYTAHFNLWDDARGGSDS